MPQRLALDERDYVAARRATGHGGAGLSSAKVLGFIRREVPAQ